jgi:hypothetical protein
MWQAVDMENDMTEEKTPQEAHVEGHSYGSGVVAANIVAGGERYELTLDMSEEGPQLDPVVEKLTADLEEARLRVLDLEKQWLVATGRKKNQEAGHGTDSGYYAHRKQWHTRPCQPCKDAHSLAERTRREKKRLIDETVQGKLF